MARRQLITWAALTLVACQQGSAQAHDRAAATAARTAPVAIGSPATPARALFKFSLTQTTDFYSWDGALVRRAPPAEPNHFPSLTTPDGLHYVDGGGRT